MSLPADWDALLRAGLASTAASSSKAAWIAHYEREAALLDNPSGPQNARSYSDRLRGSILAFVGTREAHSMSAAALDRRIKYTVGKRAKHFEGLGMNSSDAHDQALRHYGFARFPDRRAEGKALQWARTHSDEHRGPLCTSARFSGVAQHHDGAYSAVIASTTQRSA